ncbi:hypothetical protein PV326_012187 [Microctonus aethiopoides]|nr:hypothetical protein PV326_012187 [Microctonus aethiopoides]
MSASSSAEDENLFCIVEFLGKKTDLKSVDLILHSWTFTNNKALMCRYPPPKDRLKVRGWVKKQKSFRDTWPTYPIEILAMADNFEQGERRLERSYTTINIESSDAERQGRGPVKTHTSIQSTLSGMGPLPFSPSHILPGIEQELYLNSSTDNASNLGNNSNIVVENDKTISLSENQHEDDSHSLMKQFEEILKAELNKIKRSIIYDMNQKFNELKDAVSVESARKSVEDSPWKVLNFKLPRESDEEFLELEISLAIDMIKQNALKEIFHMLTIGFNNYIHDIQMIIKKLIKKDVQLLYSGTGRKIRGQGKKSFQETESYKCLNDFLMLKYTDSKEKIAVVTQVSRFLAGAMDRDGGKKERTLKNNTMATE